MLHDLFTVRVHGKTSGGLNTSDSNCRLLPVIGVAIPVIEIELCSVYGVPVGSVAARWAANR